MAVIVHRAERIYYSKMDCEMILMILGARKKNWIFIDKTNENGKSSLEFTDLKFENN